MDERPATLNEVERGAVRHFAESLGDANPIYFDGDAARAAGFKGVIAPPSFPVIVNVPRESIHQTPSLPGISKARSARSPPPRKKASPPARRRPVRRPVKRR